MNNTGDDKKVFMPLEIEGASFAQESYYFTTKKVSAVVLYTVIAMMILVGFLKSLTNTFGLPVMVVGPIMFIIYLFGLQLLGRKYIFEEKKQMELYKVQRENRDTDMSPFWGIVNDNEVPHPNNPNKKIAILEYETMATAVIIKTVKGSILDDPLGFESIYFETLARFKRELWGQGYSIIQINTEESASDGDNFNILEDSISTIENENLKLLTSTLVSRIRVHSEEFSKIETDSYLIYARNFTLARDLITNAVDAVDLLRGLPFHSVEILNKAGVTKLHQELNGVPYVDTNQLIANKYGTIADIGETKVIVVLDEHGEIIEMVNEFTEERVEDTDPLSKARAGKTNQRRNIEDSARARSGIVAKSNGKSKVLGKNNRAVGVNNDLMGLPEDLFISASKLIVPKRERFEMNLETIDIESLNTLFELGLLNDATPEPDIIISGEESIELELEKHTTTNLENEYVNINTEQHETSNQEDEEEYEYIVMDVDIENTDEEIEYEYIELTD